MFFKEFSNDRRAQLHTLEGVAAATIMLLVIVYAIDATSMTPLTSSTANVHVETELRTMGQDILKTMDYAEPGYSSKLKYDILNWNGKEYIWDGTMYLEKGNATPMNNLTSNLTEILNSTLGSNGIAHNVELTFLSENGTSFYPLTRMIYNGDPSNNAVIVSRKIVLQNSDNPSSGVVPDADMLSSFYNIVDVKLILWRM